MALACWLSCSVQTVPAWANYEAGKRAWDEMRPAEALVEWQAAADDGDRRAMLALGRLYATGLGVPQNYILAHMWFNLAASRGEIEALDQRDALAARMTPAAGCRGAGASIGMAARRQPSDRQAAGCESAFGNSVVICC